MQTLENFEESKDLARVYVTSKQVWGKNEMTKKKKKEF